MAKKKENNEHEIGLNELLKLSYETSLEDEEEAKNGKQIKEPNGYFAVKVFDQTSDFVVESEDKSKVRKKDEAKRLQE